MLSLEEQKKIKEKALRMFKKAGIPLSEDEKKNEITIVYFNNDKFYELGIVMVTTVNTERYCGRYILFLPGQSCAEHWHPDVDGNAGKEETFRVLWGTVYAYGEGEATKDIKAKIPPGKEKYFTVRKERILQPGDQWTLDLHEKHWFQAGPKGAVAYETSSAARDLNDLTTDPTLKADLFKGGI
jgi:D-lyxose ketol-isomerase